jgi:hypothetical protein
VKRRKPKCSKKRFDKIGAMLALAKAQNARSIKRLECRMYECDECGSGTYHLTSEQLAALQHSPVSVGRNTRASDPNLKG